MTVQQRAYGFTPDEDFNGNVKFSYLIKDGQEAPYQILSQLRSHQSMMLLKLFTVRRWMVLKVVVRSGVN